MGTSLGKLGCREVNCALGIARSIGRDEDKPRSMFEPVKWLLCCIGLSDGAFRSTNEREFWIRPDTTLATGCALSKVIFVVWRCFCITGRFCIDLSISAVNSNYNAVTLTCKVIKIYAIVKPCMVNKQIPDKPELAVTSEDLDALPSGRREFLSTIGILITAVLVAFFIITFVFRSYQVDGTSMLNTLQNGDKLIIWKVPRTWARITGHDYIPKRGDIIVFTETGLAQYGQQNTKQLIKRVIGLPGDHLVLKNGYYTIYNAAHPHGFDPDKTLAYGKDDNIPYTSGNINITLGPHQLFVSGDNRPDSLDSRYFGPINASQVIGQLVLRVFPIDHAEVF